MTGGRASWSRPRVGEVPCVVRADADLGRCAGRATVAVLHPRWRRTPPALVPRAGRAAWAEVGTREGWRARLARRGGWPLRRSLCGSRLVWCGSSLRRGPRPRGPRTRGRLAVRTLGALRPCAVSGTGDGAQPPGGGDRWTHGRRWRVREVAARRGAVGACRRGRSAGGGTRRACARGRGHGRGAPWTWWTGWVVSCRVGGAVGAPIGRRDRARPACTGECGLRPGLASIRPVRRPRWSRRGAWSRVLILPRARVDRGRRCRPGGAAHPRTRPFARGHVSASQGSPSSWEWGSKGKAGGEPVCSGHAGPVSRGTHRSERLKRTSTRAVICNAGAGCDGEEHVRVFRYGRDGAREAAALRRNQRGPGRCTTDWRVLLEGPAVAPGSVAAAWPSGTLGRGTVGSREPMRSHGVASGDRELRGRPSSEGSRGPRRNGCQLHTGAADARGANVCRVSRGTTGSG
jgi:hypothetical protein